MLNLFCLIRYALLELGNAFCHSSGGIGSDCTGLARINETLVWFSCKQKEQVIVLSEEEGGRAVATITLGDSCTLIETPGIPFPDIQKFVLDIVKMAITKTDDPWFD